MVNMGQETNDLSHVTTLCDSSNRNNEFIEFYVEALLSIEMKVVSIRIVIVIPVRKKTLRMMHK